MKVVTSEQMRELDRKAIQEQGMSSAALMENAGRSIADVVETQLGPTRDKRIALFCGTGNNGGDGFVAARYLALRGARPEIYLAGDSSKLRGDAATNFQLATRASGIAAPPVGQFAPERHDLVIDALLGTGATGAPRSVVADAIERIERSGLPVVSIDIPSGLNADTGEVGAQAIRAVQTVTFGYPKPGLYLLPGAIYAGRVNIADIGFNWNCLELPTGLSVTMRGELRIRPRAPGTNKGDFGHVGGVAGSRGMVGAPSMAARAAQRSGAGLVTVLTPVCAQPIIAGKLDEQMTIPLPESDGAASEEAFDIIQEFAQKATVLCVGPGMTTHPHTCALIHRLIAERKLPLVLDADGLNALSKEPELLAGVKQDTAMPVVLTPHPGEAARLLGTSIQAIQSDRISAARQIASRYGATVVLKGNRSLISSPNGEVRINTNGNPGMATGGMGDALTGIVGSLLAQAIQYNGGLGGPEGTGITDKAVQEIVSLAVFVHGAAGDLAAAKVGEAGLVTDDLIAELPAAIRELEAAS